MANEIRLIDANELLNKFWLLPGHIRKNEMDLIRDAPTVDAVPVVHGRWLANGICNHKPYRFKHPDKWTVWKCSECNYSNGRRRNANYCPNCGAKMDGKDDAE